MLEIEGWDLRDPKLSLMPDGRLLLLAGASRFSRKKVRLAHQTVVAFSSDGVNWSPFEVVLDEEWLWRITWFQGVGYGISYFYLDREDAKGEWGIRLYQTQDGKHYDSITSFAISGKPNEATLRFHPTGQMIALLRRDGKQDNHAWIGTSYPPYEDWLWSETERFFGAPNFIILPDGKMWAAGRILSLTPYGLIEQTALVQLSFKSLHPKLILPSGGDTSYPGMVYEAPHLWISYYSSHQRSTAIYLAQIEME